MDANQFLNDRHNLFPPIVRLKIGQWKLFDVLSHESAATGVQFVVKHRVVKACGNRRIGHRQHQAHPIRINVLAELDPVTIAVDNRAGSIEKKPRLFGNIGPDNFWMRPIRG